MPVWNCNTVEINNIYQYSDKNLRAALSKGGGRMWPVAHGVKTAMPACTSTIFRTDLEGIRRS